MARAGATAVLFALVCCLLVGPAPARSPVELSPQVVLNATVHGEASVEAEPLPPKPLAIVEAADPSTVLSSVEGQTVDPAVQAPQVIRCGGEDAAFSEEQLSLDISARPAGKGAETEKDGQKQPDDSDSDTDCDSDSDDEDNKNGIMGWFWSFWRLARRF